MPNTKGNKRKANPQEDQNYANFQSGSGSLSWHPIFGPLMQHATIISRGPANQCPKDGWAIVTSDGTIHANAKRRAESEEWTYILAHCLLHLGFGHFEHAERHSHFPEWNMACDMFISKFLFDLKLGTVPEAMQWTETLPAQSEERIYEILLERGLPSELRTIGTGEPSGRDMIAVPPKITYWGKPIDWQDCFGKGLTQAVTQVVQAASNAIASHTNRIGSPAYLARAWFINNYPLLGSLAATFDLIEDASICNSMSISVAAVCPESREIYLNPAAGLSQEELRFVMAHELLHVGLRHEARRQGRDAYLWNVACDYVINGWLVEMGIGNVPKMGLLYDPTLKGESAEAIYDLMVTDMRRFRKLQTFRGFGLGDIMDGGKPNWWESGAGLDLDEFYRRCLSQGLEYAQSNGRGFLPADLVEEIRALSQPPIEWDIELAKWFDNFFPPLDKIRTYARPSRRQSSTPDIARPRYVPPVDGLDARTFGVVLDTSGSMDRILLAKALGSIASYSIAREVPAVRVVFCDAITYDQGYMLPEAIADVVKVRGRGGTILQPGIDLLENAKDFPIGGPILVITDAECDSLRIRREHAFLIPDNKRLPFTPVGPVFRVK